MSYLLSILPPQVRPNMFVPNAQKDKNYDRLMARSFLSTVRTDYVNDMRMQYYVNRMFTAGNYWPKEDIETFLEDKSGESRNRIKLVQNIFRPVIDGHQNAVLNMSINATAEPMTYRVQTRREAALGRLKIMQRAAEGSARMRSIVEQQEPIGQTDAQTERNFDNLYQDSVTKATNSLMDVVASYNGLAEKLPDLGLDFDQSGLVCLMVYPHQDMLAIERISPDEVIHDTSCTSNDMNESGFVCVAPLYNLPRIGERFNPPETEMKKVDEMIRNQIGRTTGANLRDGKIPVHYVFWEDVDYRERGYVKNEFGQPELVEVNDAKLGEKAKYTDKDLIQPPENIPNRDMFTGYYPKHREQITVCRHCVLVPQEYLTGSLGSNDMDNDWVLRHGEYELQETDWFDTNDTKFPVKIQVWRNNGGQIISPLTDAVSMQRLTNQALTTFSSLLDQTGGSGISIDEMAISPRMKEDKLRTAIKNAEPVILNAKGGGVNNAIGRYDATPTAGLTNIMAIVPYLNNATKEMTGSTDAMRGQQQGADQAVGVTKMMLAQGMSMQAVFLYGLSAVLKQVYQCVAQAGRKFYAKNPMKLEEIVGADEIMAVLATSDGMLERMRVKIRMDSDQQQLIEQGNAQIIQFIQLGMLDGMAASELWGKSSPTEVGAAASKFAALQAQAARAQQMQQERAIQQGQIMAKQAQLDQQASEVYDSALAEASKERDREMKGNQPYRQHEAESMFRPPEPATAPAK